MRKEKLIFVVVFMVCSFIGGRLFAAYELQKPTWSVVDCGLNGTIGTVDYADGLDKEDGEGYRLDSSIGPLGEVNWEPETPSGTIVESGFYHIYYSTWIENPRFVFYDNEISSTTIRFKLESDNPAWTQYAIAFSSAVDYDSLFKNTTSYINKDGDIVTSWNEAEDWNPASFYEEIELTSLHPNTIYGLKIRSKLPPELPPTDWSGDTDNFTWTHIETPGIMVELCITSATVRAVGTLSNLYVENTRINFGIDDDWAGYIPDTSCTFTGLSPNTSYMFKVQARNGEQDETDVVSMSTYTLCHPPQNPYITDISSTSLKLAWVEPLEGGVIYYRIRENGSLIADEYTELSLHRPDLSVNEEYTYKIYAVNKATQTHDMSSVTISTYTFCSIPPAPQIVDISSDTIRIVIEPGDNPERTEYSIKVSSAVGFASYVQDDYRPGDHEVFQTRTIWGSPLTIINLGSNVEYTISVQASNKYNNVTDYGASVSSCTYAAVPRLELVQDVAAGTVQITILEGNNSPETEYAIYEEWNDGGGWDDRGYLQYPGGSTNPNPDWQTKATWEGSQGFFEVVDLNLTDYQFRFKAKARRTIPGYSKEDTVEIQGPLKGWSPYVYAGNIYISITAPPDGACLRGEQTIIWESAGISSVNIYLGPELIGFTSDDKFSFDTRNYLDGSYWIKVAKSDQETTCSERLYTIDNTTPTITDVDINPNPVNHDYLEAYGLSINFNIIDANVNSEEIKGYLEGRSCEIEEDPDFYHDYAAIPPPPYDYISEGANTVHLYAEDLAGNTTDFYSILVYDNQAPTGTMSNLEVFVTSITISVDASDDWQQIGSVVNYISYTYIIGGQVDGVGGDSYIYTGLSPNIEYDLEVELRDAAGNVNTSISISTSTLCAPPGRPSIKEVYISSMTVEINLGSSYTPQTAPRFSLAISSSAVTYYVKPIKPNGSFHLYETTATYSDWGEESGVTITGLNPSTQYTLKCRAMDNSGVFTDWSDTRIVSTLCEPIEITAFKILLDGTTEPYHQDWTNITDFRFILGGASNYSYVLHDTTTDVVGSEVDIPISPSGTWDILFKGENPTGTDETTDYYKVKVDTISPEIDENIEAKFLDEVHDEVLHEEDEHTCHSPTFICRSTDTLSGVAGYSISFSTDSTDEPDVIIDTITASIELKLTESYENGTYYFRVRAIDNAGNPSQDFAEFEYKYKADWVPPEATIEIDHKIRRGDEVKGVEKTNTLPNIPKIIFTEEVLSQGVKNNVEVELIRDNEGNKKEGEEYDISCNITREAALSWKADPGEDWKSNHTYKVTVNKGIVDKATNSLKERKELIFTTMLNHEEKNVVLWESDKKARMILEQNTLQEDGYILIGLWDEVENGTKEAIEEADKNVRSTGDRYCYDLEKSLREMRGYTREDNEMAIEKAGTVYIELPYEDKDPKNGIVDSTEGSPAPVNEQTLSIYWLDEKHNLWVKVPGTKVDRKNKIAKAQVTGFGVYTLMGGSFYGLSEAYAYPVPYKPNDGNDLTGTEEEGITFTGLSSEAEIKIYTITGELVKKIVHEGGDPKEEWRPVENEKGEKVVSGVYIYYIKNDKEHKSGKLMIIR